MKRVIVTLILALLPAACIDNGTPSYGPGYSQGGCRQYKSCATCTPVLGCGWCSMGTKGLCAEEPNACWGAGVPNFSWTWELAFCPATGDGGAEDGANTDGANTDGAPAATDGGLAGGGSDVPANGGDAISGA
ncbi:MAG TPA: hypothetical protein VFH73_00550 [Polyangia bacterium]|jgi:hypothetical protein|nr:hypothetical protein [Polyangia bacterium]